MPLLQLLQLLIIVTYVYATIVDNSTCNESDVIISAEERKNHYAQVCDDDCLTKELNIDDIDKGFLPFLWDDYPKLHLPTIDLNKFENGSPKEKETVLKEFDYYLSTIGSVSITNHGIPSQLIDEMFEKGEIFFNTSLEYKMKHRSGASGSSGYSYWGSYAGAEAYGKNDQPPDLTENYAMYNHDYPDTNLKWKAFGKGKENTPNELYDVAQKYLPQIQRVLDVVHKLTALALGLNEDYFANITSKTPGRHLRWFHYPPLDFTKLLPKQRGVSEHCDYLLITLFTYTGRGTQFRIGDVWVDAVKKSKYDLIFNAGEMLELWTNSHWKASWHRVIPQPKTTKFTVSFLTGPDQDAIIAPIKGCYECTKEPQKYVTRTAAEAGAIRYLGADSFDGVVPEGQQFWADN